MDALAQITRVLGVTPELSGAVTECMERQPRPTCSIASGFGGGPDAPVKRANRRLLAAYVARVSGNRHRLPFFSRGDVAAMGATNHCDGLPADRDWHRGS